MQKIDNEYKQIGQVEYDIVSVNGLTTYLKNNNRIEMLTLSKKVTDLTPIFSYFLTFRLNCIQKFRRARLCVGRFTKFAGI